MELAFILRLHLHRGWQNSTKKLQSFNQHLNYCIHIEITPSSWVAKLPPLSPSAADDDEAGFLPKSAMILLCIECYGFPTNMETPITSDSQSGVRTHCLLIATKNHYSLRILDEERSKYLQRLCLVSLKISQDIKLKKYLNRLKKNIRTEIEKNAKF